jgi:hypothetical protein
MKRLFVLRHSKSGVVVKDDNGNPLYFASKPDAKKIRTEGQVVSYGPDHRKFKGVL